MTGHKQNEDFTRWFTNYFRLVRFINQIRFKEERMVMTMTMIKNTTNKSCYLLCQCSVYFVSRLWLAFFLARRQDSYLHAYFYRSGDWKLERWYIFSWDNGRNSKQFCLPAECLLWCSVSVQIMNDYNEEDFSWQKQPMCSLIKVSL